MVFYHLLAVTLAYLLDLLIGDPKNWPHPVRWMGALIGFLDKRWNKGGYKIWMGLLMTGTVLVTVLLVTYVTVFVMYSLHPAAGVLWEVILISTAIAQRSLKEAAMEVYHPLSNSDLTEARTKLSYIVGRDTDRLDVSEVVRGTVETVAENTSDGVTAPLFWGAIGGAPFAIVYRAINTCDSMVGYRNERYGQFGWASAKLDDLVNWIPSRLTALMMLVSMKSKVTGFRDCWRITLRDAPKHPSPNSGWGEAATASILGIQLGGVNYYKGCISDRARMGTPIVNLKPIHIQESITIMRRASFGFLLLLWIGGISIEIALTWI
ncbi:adenosylcobinamide-phosphate synthase CbiB [Bacillus sp. V59.32b]|uniref:adenosylcobinamide-phosphate synthase CbiB n=1 Tax=Bacillus sp. V59.32b TaxID=1758642 RepID=UPI000E3CBC45|nr:adenosylcobinamide-phosphate synthase CbiB [Bacillus sp. V59.32b]RFU68002.1 cobalamin biosynthesis protein CobD [Bacillus sp. V59.32b]